MANRPATVPTWATDAVATGGPQVGNPTRVEPTTGEKAEGWYADTRPPVRKFNWLLGVILDWIGYVADLPLLNWHAGSWLARVSPYGATDVAAFDSSHTRSDGSAAVFWAPDFLAWIATGKNSAEHFFAASVTGEEPLDFASGSGLGKKYNAGCCTGTRVLLASGDDFSSSTLKLDRSGASDLTTWASITLHSGVHTDAQVNDLVALSNGHVVAVGAVDAGMKSWVSTDNGALFAEHVVDAHFTVGFQPLSGVSIGKNDRVFTWLYDTAGANGGDALWYSDDEGVTWNTGSPVILAQGKIRKVIYVEAFDQYVVFTDDHYGITDDATEPTHYTWAAFGATFQAAETNGSDIVLTLKSGTNYVSYIIWDCMSGFPSSGGRTIHLNAGQVHNCAIGMDGQFALLSTTTFQLSLKAAARA